MKKVLLALLLAASAFAQSAGDMQKTLAAEAEKLRALATDPAIVAAVKAQNARKSRSTPSKSSTRSGSPARPRHS
jgi:hypothetical protein